MYPREFDYQAPTSLEEAVQLLVDQPGAKIMAGGMSLLPMMKLRLLSPEVVIDIGRIPDLDRIDDAGEHLSIGALVRHQQVATSPLLQEHAAALATAAAWTGDRQVRNRGTCCGVMAHADLAADQTAAALALGASMVVLGPAGRREIEAAQFFVDTLTSALQPDEILVELRIPKRRPGSGSAYDKLGRRGGHTDYAVAGAAAAVTVSDGRVTEARVAITGVGSRPQLAPGVAEALIGTDGSESAIRSAAARAMEGIHPLEDLFGSEAYKAHLAEVYARRALTSALSEAA